MRTYIYFQNHGKTCTQPSQVAQLLASRIETSSSAEVYTNSTLNTYGLIINTLYRILICMQCECCIDHTKVHAHFLAHHHGLKLPQDLDTIFANMLQIEYPYLLYPPTPPT